MKQLMTAVVAAAVGAVVALLFGGLGRRPDSTSARRMEAREFVLVDENNQRAAVLESTGGRSVLRFYAGNSAPALEVGVDGPRKARFIQLFGKEGRVIAALNSLPPNGETTLYLGDERWEARVIMGALQTDIPATTGVDDWGLEFRTPGSRQALFHILVKSDEATRRSTATVGLVRRDGSSWAVE